MWYLLPIFLFLFLLFLYPKPAKSHRPRIFIPGSSAGQERFNYTIWRLGGRDPIKLTVHPDGYFDLKGSSPNFIVIGFKDNRDRLESIEAAALQLTTLLPELQRRFHFDSYDAVGHSNGGLIWLRLVHQLVNTPMKSLTTLASPYQLDGLPQVGVVDQISMRSYHIAGAHDLLVPVREVESGRRFFMDESYHFKLLKGPMTGHSSLPQHPLVIKHLKELAADN